MSDNEEENITSDEDSIVIDESRGLVFDNEEDIYQHFIKEIELLEKEYREWRGESDLPPEDFTDNDVYLTEMLQSPDEVWFSEDTIDNVPLGTFIAQFEDEETGESFYYVAVTYFVEDTPKFVFIHFPTIEPTMIEKYKRGDKVFSKNDPHITYNEEAVDALSEGDEFATGLYQAMLTLRSKTDISEEQFDEFKKHREDTIEEPDEVWKSTDSQGNILIRFIKKINDDENIFYVVTTLEEEASESQYLLFSFPTNDMNLVTRYKQGECLEATSYIREESH